MDKTRVVLADDHPFLRAGIRKILDRVPDIVVIGEAGDGFQALDLVEELAPDLLILDVEMPGKNGIQVARELHEDDSHVRILVLSAYDNGPHIRGMFEAGVAGYLTKDEVPEVLVKAIRGIMRGSKRWVSDRVAAKLPPNG